MNFAEVQSVLQQIQNALVDVLFVAFFKANVQLSFQAWLDIDRQFVLQINETSCLLFKFDLWLFINRFLEGLLVCLDVTDLRGEDLVLLIDVILGFKQLLN